MWYLVTGGSGLALGIVLLIWALRERSLRFDAQRNELEALDDRAKAVITATLNAKAAKDLSTELERIGGQLNIVRLRNLEARRLLAEHGCSSAIALWLDSELATDEL